MVTDINDDSIFCFISDKTTICGQTKFDRNENLLNHPYNCAKFITCHMNHTFSKESYVWSYEDGRHVFDRASRSSAWDYDPAVKSCKQERKLRFVQIYFLWMCLLLLRLFPLSGVSGLSS